MQYGQVWKHDGRHVFILGNCVQEDGTIWVADRITGRSVHVPTRALSPVRTRTNTFDELTERCIVWARRGNADAAWWLGWRFDGEQHAKSVWYYVAAMRKDPRSFGWAWERVYSDAQTAYMCDGVPTPCIKFVHDVAEFKGQKSADWKEAIAKAETAVDVAVAQAHLDEVMALLSDPVEAQSVALSAGIPYHTLSAYQPYQEWRKKVITLNCEAPMIAKCIGCGCSDWKACWDESGGEPCSWLVVDYIESLGVCSACPDDMVRWNAGDRTPAVPMERETTVLQIWIEPSGQWAGRILRGDVERVRVEGCVSQEEVERHAIKGGIDLDRVERLDHVPDFQYLRKGFPL